MRVLFPTSQTLGATLPAGTWHQSFVLEVVLTAILMFVVMCVSTGSKEVGVMAGIAVGGVVGLEATFAGPVCGASMNPARSLGPAIVAGYPQHLWIYIVAPVAGALVGVLGWKGIRPTVAVQASLPKG
jgi:aquaporin Z